MEIYTQGDIRWANKKLGKSGLRMKDFGCVVTCCAQALTVAGYRVTPGELVDKLNRIDGFTANGLLIWAKVTQLYPQFHYNQNSGSQFDFVQLKYGRYLHFVLNHRGVVYDPLYGKNSYPPGSENIGYRYATILGTNGQPA